MSDLADIDIRGLRDRLGWSQERLAEELGLDRSTVSRMESGQPPSGPTLKLLRRLAEGIAHDAHSEHGGECNVGKRS